jgi:hypothetical protein
MVGRRRTAVDPATLLAAAMEMRRISDRVHEASLEIEKGLIERAGAGADNMFGNSEQAQRLAANWDKAVNERVEESEDLSQRTLKMAEKLEVTRTNYVENDVHSATEFDRIRNSTDA